MLLVAICFCFISVCLAQAPTVLLVSIDGFRWDYLDRDDVDIPHLRGIRESGASAERVINVFPTLTFPSHYSIATGLYPESHGIIGNNMYDPILDETFNMASTESYWWEGGEPIWITAVKAGLVSATYFWPGSEAEIHGYRPTYWYPYDGSVGYTERVDQVVDWLAMPEGERPSLITLYFDEPDHTAHTYGPDSPETADAIEMIDGVIGDMLYKIEPYTTFTSIIVTGDHGMAETSKERVFFLEDHVNASLFYYTDLSPMAGLWPRSGQEDAWDDVVETLLGVQGENVTFYKKEDIPEEWNYSDHERIPPLVGLSDLGYTIMMNREQLSDPDWKFLYGAHGYLYEEKDMNPLFLAQGPAFLKEAHVPTIRTVDIYETICFILNLQAEPNNGTYTSAFRIMDIPTILAMNGALDGFAGSSSSDSDNAILYAVIGIVGGLVLVTLIFVTLKNTVHFNFFPLNNESSSELGDYTAA